jgi:uncharacterized Ntn-hydrolase superfamily protein
VTYSIVALDRATGDLGVATQSKFLAVGAVVPWAQAGVGAIATQSFANVAFGPDGLASLRTGLPAAEALARLLAADELRDERQVGVVDRDGGAATHTGRQCFAWAGGRTGEGFAAQGNILAGAAVMDGLADTYLAGGRSFPELLVACLAAAEVAGGDRRGRESAALLVVREGGGFGGGNDRWIDLRVDHHDDPVGELGRLLAFQRLYYDQPDPETLLPLDEATAAEVRAVLLAIGGGPDGRFGRVYEPMFEPRAAAEPASVVGEPRALPPGWDAAWQQAFNDWLDAENLESCTTAPGWIDPRALDILRTRRPT